MRFGFGVLTCLAVYAALLWATITQPAELAHAEDLVHEAVTVGTGLIAYGLLNWLAMPQLNWSDLRDRKLPDVVRAASVIAQAIILWACVSAAGQF